MDPAVGGRPRTAGPGAWQEAYQRYARLDRARLGPEDLDTPGRRRLALRPFAMEGGYVNDPGNLFRLNQNLHPASLPAEAPTR